MSLLRFLLSGAGAATTQTIGVTNANLFFSPYNTYSDGAGAMAATNVKASSTYALMVNTGAYLKFRVTVASGGAGYVAITLDTTAYNGLTASTCPTLSYSYNKRPFTHTLLAYSASAVTQVLANGLAAGTYEFEVRFKSVGTTAFGAAADRWTTPKYAIKTTGLVIDSTASIPSQTLRPNRLLVFGASYSEGVNVLLPDQNTADDLANAMNNASLSFAALIAVGLDAEYGIVAYGGQGFDRGTGSTPASASNPSFYNATAANQSWDKYFASTARDFTSPSAPTAIVVDQGFNDQGALPAANVTAVFDAMRTAVGATTWMFQKGQNSDDDANIITGVANVASTARTKYIAITDWVTENTPSEYSGDAFNGGSHPNQLGQTLVAVQLLNEMQEYMSAVAGSAGVLFNAGKSGGFQ